MSAEGENKSIVSPSTWMEKLDQMLESKNFITEGLDKFQQKTNIKKRYIAIAIFTLLAIYLVIGYGASLLCNMIGFVYPAYISMASVIFFSEYPPTAPDQRNNLPPNVLQWPVVIDYRWCITGFFLMWIASGYFAALLCNAIGFLYPAYKSVKAIESKDKDDDTEWLMYWVVFAAFSVCEFFSDIFLSWFPFYFLAKCVFLLWCMAPGSYNGSSMIYFKFIRPFILRNEVTIDNVLHIAGGKAKEFTDATLKEAKEAAATVAAEVVSESLKKDE